MILFDWGTYNGLGRLYAAASLGMKLTEIPPRDLVRRKYDEDYWRKYGEYASRAFTTITAHAPYYNAVSLDRESMEKSWRGFIEAARKAKLARAMIYNVHLGWRAFLDQRDLEFSAELLKKLVAEVGDSMLISVEVPYTRRMIGTWEEVKALREMVDPEKVIVSVQLENAWLYETGAGDTGRLEEANAEADEGFWERILEKTLSLTHTYISLRFSQVIGFALGRRILKKRVPLGKGYPDLDPLARALARFIVKRVREKGLPLSMHIIYTGPPETKYKDTIMLYAKIMMEAVRYL